MNRTEFLKELKRIMESEDGCTTKTTPKKGLGFVPYNRYGIKWGQVDAEKKHVRLVFDLNPGSLLEESLQERTGLSITPQRKLSTGYRFSKTESGVGHDQLILFLEDDFLKVQTTALNEILMYAKEFARCH